MSNNKQSSVETFFDELCNLGYIEYPNDPLIQNRLKQAKAMNKEQHRQTANVVRQAIFDWNYSSFDEYYNENYGGNNDQQ